MRIFYFLLLWLVVNASCAASIYYVDYNAANDSANGTSTSTPWKRAPTMIGFGGSYSHSAGDQFVFKGGVTWPASCFTLVHYQKSGTVDNWDTYTYSSNYFVGGAFSMPVFDGEDTLVSGTGLFSGVHSLMHISDSDYVKVFGIEFKRLFINNEGDPLNTGIPFNGYGIASIYIDNLCDNVTVQQCLIRHWKPQATNDSDFGGIFSDGTYVRILQNTVGWGRAANVWETNSSGTCLHGGWWCTSNHFAAAFQFINAAPFDIGYNEFGPATNTAEPSAHCNGIYQTSFNGGTVVIHNNVFHDLDVNFQTMLLHPAGAAGTFGLVTNSTSIIYNNLIYYCLGSHGIVLDDRQLATADNTIRVMIWNNTIQGFGFGAVGGDDQTPDYLWSDIRGNHWIFDLPTTGSSTPVEASFAQTQVMGSNIWHSITNVAVAPTAASAGYTYANQYKWTSGSSPTVLAGVSLTATNVAGQDGALHPVKFDLLGVARPSSGNWDAGAYQFSSGGAGVVAGPVISLTGRQTWSGRITLSRQ